MIDHNRLAACYNEIFKTPLPVLSEWFESIIARLYTHLLSPGDASVDVGAHIGRHAVPMGRIVGKRGTVLAFEPIPEIEKELRRNILSAELDGVVISHNMAAGNFSGEAEFIVIEDAPGLSGLKERQYYHQHQQRKIQIRVEMLDRMVPENLQIKFIKVDAEGGDFDVLRGAVDILKTHRPVVVFECGAVQARHGESYGFSREDFTSFFKTVTYDLFTILGLEYNSDTWEEKTPWYLVALPAEGREKLYGTLQMSAVEGVSIQMTHMSSALGRHEEEINEQALQVSAFLNVIERKDKEIAEKVDQLLREKKELEKIKESYSYRTGKILLSPARFARKHLFKAFK